MAKFFSIKNAQSSIKESLDRDPRKSVFRPDRTWRLILVVFFSACVVSVIFSFYLYREIGSESIFGAVSSGEESISTVNRGKLESALESLRAQSASEKELENKLPAIADPSR